MRKPRLAPSPTSDVERPRRRGLKIVLIAGAATAVVVVAAGLTLYGYRGAIGTRLAVDYLAKRGVPAVITIDRLDPGGFAGAMKLGPPNDPDLTVERIEIEFEPIPLFTGGLAAPRLRSMRLVRPKLKGRYDGKKLSFGTLQPMIDEILAQPLVQPGPSFRIENGELRLATYAGPAVLTGEAVVDQGRLRRAIGHLAATRLTLRPGVVAVVNGADIDLQGRADRLASQVSVDLAGLSGPVVLGAGKLGLEASVPYGAQGFARLDGPIAAALTADIGRAQGQGVTADKARLTARISGTSSGPMGALTLDLSGEADAGADRLTGPKGAVASKPAANFKAAKFTIDQRGARTRLSGEGVTVAATADRAGQDALSLLKARLDLTLDRLQADSEGARWSFKAPLKLRAAAARLEDETPAGRISLPAVVFAADGDTTLASDKPIALAFTGSAGSGVGGLSRADAAELAAGLAAVADPARVRAALSSFRLSAPAWRIAIAPAGVEMRLDRPLAVLAGGGVSATLSGVGGGPLLKTGATGGGSGGASFQIAGQGLPRLLVSAPAYSLSKDGRLRADLALDAGLDGAQLKGATLKGAGRLDAAAGGLSFTPRGCLQTSLSSAGPASAPSLQDAKAALCGEPGRPLFAAGAAGWRADGRVKDGAARLGAAQVAVQNADLRFSLAGRDQTRGGKLTLVGVRVVDALPQRRFLPVTLAGDFTLGQEALTGRATVRDAAKGATLAVFDVRQSTSSAEGSAEISSDLAFAKGGLQPADLSPLAQGQISDADLKLHFAGRAAWGDKGVTGGGRLTTSGAAFKSAYGQVAGASADIAVTSFAPLVVPPGQTVSAARLNWMMPLTEIKATFGATDKAITISEAGATMAHGRVSLAPMTAPFDPKADLKGVLRLEGVDLGELIAGSTLSDSVTLQAKVNGSLPFSMSPSGVRLTNGVVASVGAGRLSIKRQALTGAVATAGAEGAQPNAVQDFAYQALENLAFDTLDAKLESRPEGRLGTVLHLIGRNDPPNPARARIALIDVLRGRAFDKAIPLPKGTPVDLTLDTSLNFDELLKAYGEFGKNGSAPVQP